jgi:choline dehydrogenase-like flavoprotein
MIKEFENNIINIAERININNEINPDWLWSAAHQTGTVSMGKNDDGEVDESLRLKGTNNVYVCDGSVIQESSYANIGLSIAQLAEYLSDNIKKIY